MKAFLKSNLFFKIASVIVAAILWLYVVQFENPEFQISMSDIPVRLENESVLSDNNLMITSRSKSTVTLKIKGKRQTVSDLDQSGVSAVIDLKSITAPGEYKLPVKVSFSENNLSVADNSMPKILISVENKVQYEHKVKLKTIGDVKNGYYAVPDDAAVTVRVISPESTAHLVTSARAELDISGATGMVEASVPVKLYDENGNPVKSHLIKCEPENAAVRCFIYPTKQVPVIWKEVGVMPERAIDLVVSSKSVSIAGPESKLSEINSINLGEINLSAFSESNNYRVFKLEENPALEGLYIAEREKSLSLTMKFVVPEQPSEPDTDKKETSENITVKSISLEGIPEGYNAEVLTSSVSVKVSGNKDEVSAIKAEDLTVTVDLSGISDEELSKTEHELPAIITTSKPVSIDETKYVKVRITPTDNPPAEADVYEENPEE